MLMDLLMELVIATGKEDREAAYRNLEKVGVDRITADVMAECFNQKGGDTGAED